MTFIGAIIFGIVAILYSVFKKNKAELDLKKWSEVPASVRRWVPLAKSLSSEWGVPEKYIMGVIWVENKGRMKPDGAAGEKGIMQIKEIAVKDLRLNGYRVPDDWRINPASNIETGVKVLHLFRTREANWEKTVRAYNQGNRGEDIYTDKAEEYLSKVKSKINSMPYG